MVLLRSWAGWACLAAWSTTVRATVYSPEALADKVDWSALPGAEGLEVKDGFNMFAGYINVDQENGRRIFYWFMEAQENAEDAPVILWTNGGPGCSGMLGLLTEHGPFQVRDGGNSLVDNDYSWNKLANMLYVEIPSGVGFSYSDTLTDYQIGDDATAVDNYWLVQGWLDRFPHYRSNDFHISSESYGGHYMPQLAEEILKRNDQVRVDKSAPVINFAGFLVGNPYTDARSNQVAQYQKYWGDQLLPKPVYARWLESCVGADYGLSGDLDACNTLEESMDSYLGNLNPYALDYPMCLGGSSDGEVSSPLGGVGLGAGQTIPRSQRAALKEHLHRARHGGAGGQGVYGAAGPYEPCAEDFTIPYLNRADVQEALHVREGTVWEQCSTKVDYDATDLLRPMMPYYQRLLGDYGLKILVFSGDDDAVCATEGTQWWIYDLGYEVDERCYWKTWTEGGQVAGYQTRFNDVDLAFVTVHVAGHEVPAYQPARALKLLGSYLDGSWWRQEEKSGGLEIGSARVEVATAA
eukprot:jgi/Undpi1/9942/HiC_scaffold_28.g12396.m1